MHDVALRLAEAVRRDDGEGVREALAEAPTAALSPARVTRFSGATEDYTPVHLAALLGSTRALSEMITLGIDTDAPALDGTGRARRPLHFAAGMGRAEAVELLLAAGADPNAHDAEGLTPFSSVGRWGDCPAAARRRMWRTLREYGGLSTGQSARQAA